MTPIHKILISSAVFWPSVVYTAIHMNGKNAPALALVGGLIGGLFGFYHSKLIGEAMENAG